MFVAGSSSIFNGDISDYRDNIRELRKSIIWQWVFMKVSVIVTAYNKENYIRKCLESVINQDCNDWELIIVEDGSTDNTKEVIEQFVKPYLENITYKDRIKLVLHSENNGLNAARNTGLENVSCEFFTFLDGDDYYEPNAISTLLNAYYKTNADLVIGEFTNVDEKTGERDRRLIFDRCGTALQ